MAAEPGRDGGTVSPTAAISSMPYAPHYAMQVLENFAGSMRKKVWGDFGPRDGVSIRDDWVSDFTLAIDQLPMVCMIENYRSSLLWNLFMSDKDVRNGLETAGLAAPEHAEGFPEVVVPLRRESGAYVPDALDIRRHPDTGLYSIPYCIARAGRAAFRIVNEEGEEVFARSLDAPAGSSVLAFPQFLPRGDEILTLTLTTEEGSYSLPLRLR
jgi:hypothetical protein